MNTQSTLTPDAYLCKWPDGGTAASIAPANPEGAVSVPLYALSDEEWGSIVINRQAKTDAQNKAEIASMAIRVAGEYMAWCREHYARPSGDGFSLDGFYSPKHFGFNNHLVGPNAAISFAQFYERVLKIISISAGA
jgi:hypothetical protein